MIKHSRLDYGAGRDYADEFSGKMMKAIANICRPLSLRQSPAIAWQSDVWYGYDWQTGQDKEFNEWVIADLSSSGVIDPESIRWNVNIAGYEEEFNEDIDNNGAIGVTAAALIELRSEEPNLNRLATSSL